MSPQTGNAKNPPLNRPSKYKPPGGLYVENCPQIHSKTSKKGKFTSNYKVSPINFKTQIFLRRYAPQKGPLKNINPGAYFRNFTVYLVVTIL